MRNMKIYVASDHGGFELKEKLKPFLESLGHEVEDCGAYELHTEDDYPDFITPCADNVVVHSGSFGVIIGASGQGEAMAANRVPGARAAVYYGEGKKPQTDSEWTVLGIVESSRAHNNANILSLGARFLTEQEAYDAVGRFLETPFLGDVRHIRRIDKLA